MQVLHCEQCSTPLPWTAHYCAHCGVPLSLHASISDDPTIAATYEQDYTTQEQSGSFKTYAFYSMGPGDPDATQPIDRSQMRTSGAGVDNSAVSVFAPVDNPPGTHGWIEEWPEEAVMDGDGVHRDTWQKFVTRKTSAIPVETANVVLPVIADTPRLSIPPSNRVGAGLAPAPVKSTPSPNKVGTELVPARIKLTPPALPWQKKRIVRSSLMPRLAGWIAIFGIVALLLGGGFGVFLSLGRNAPHGLTNGPLTLQVSPTSIAFGGIITLRGSHFTPRVRVGLTRDATIPVIDTGGSAFTTTDASGSFNDTISIDGSWTTGVHIIRAEDARLHKIATFTILVTGHGVSLRPAHLVLSVNTIDFGSGDQATNSDQSITLSNAGGGEIDWQSTTTQPWLMLSPKSGSIAVGQHMLVTLGADRSSLKVGSYTASVIFTSNTGDVTLPVKMQITPLQAGHEPVIQVTPAVLSFTGADGGASPPSQIVTISNPGALPLQWNASSTTNDGSNWLSTSPQSGTVAKGDGQSIAVSVNSSQLLPGVYYGSITFSSPGQAVVNNPQTIYVSVTISPQCTIQVTPGSLSFTGVYLQPAPQAKNISVGVNQSCSSPVNWSVSATTTSGGRWLSINASAGRTPSTPSVGINVTALKPGSYSGALVFSSAAGTQTVPVTLVMGQATTPILTSAPALLNVNGVIGQTTPSIQSIVVSDTGGGTLSWSAAATTTVGGAWLSVSPPSGTLAPKQSTTLTVTVTLLKTLIPGSYSGSLTLTGKDSAGNAAAGSPQTLPVTFIVQAPCSVTTPLPALTFQSVFGQPAPVPQQIIINAAGACANPLSWSAAVATVPAGGTWLTATPATGTVSATISSSTLAGIVTTGLAAGNYSGSITITAIDSVTHLAVGTPQIVTVTLTVQPTCTLQAPSTASETFSSEAGQNPAVQTFTIGVVGACTGNVTITPTATMASGAGWLAVTPASASVAANGTATFTVTVTSAALAAGPYAGTISLAALNSTGIAITGSPQAVGVGLTVLSPPALSTTPASLTFNIMPGVSTQTITIKNTGGEPLNWSAALASNAPAYVTIASAASGSLAAGASASLTISVNATNVPPGTTASTSVTISATDPITNGSVSGSPSVAAISVSITAPPPAMQLSTTALTFTTTAGVTPAAQSLTITNTGGGTLNWAAGTPSQAWLTVSPSSGSDAAGGTSTPSFSVNVTGLTGTQTATVTFTAPGGISQTVTVTLTIN